MSVLEMFTTVAGSNYDPGTIVVYHDAIAAVLEVLQ